MGPGKARLLTGVSCVGSLVIASSVMLATDSPALMFPSQPTGPVAEYFSLLSFFAAVALLMLPFDLVGGIAVPSLFEASSPRAGKWLRQWLRSVAIQSLFFSGAFFFYLQIGRACGATSLIAIFAIMQVALLAGQELIWQSMTANWPALGSRGRTLFVSHVDHRFSGGITGLPGFETILVPDSWKTHLRPPLLEAVIARRHAALETGGRMRGVIFAMLWNLTGFTIAILAHRGAANSVADLISIFLWFLLFSFMGLLVLPVFSRISVFGLDRQASKNIGSTALIHAITELDRVTEQDDDRSPRAESIFQPIPCPKRRSEALTAPGSETVPVWNIARSALFLSWAFGGPLARAVHCNVGRPELWALVPSD